MKITSPEFNHNKEIPSKYTCDGINVSPELKIEDILEEAKTLALICDDPDAPNKTWVHWVIFNIHIPEANEIIILPDARPGTDGVNDFHSLGYGGPCPPSGTHRYFFKVFALDTELDLKKGATKEEVESAMQGHVLDNAKLIGLYGRN